mgnify:CR=1 FL=1
MQGAEDEVEGSVLTYVTEAEFRKQRSRSPSCNSLFHAEIVVDVAKVSAETKAYQPIPIIADFTNENGSDSLRETIEANYRQVKQEVLSLVDREIERIKNDSQLKSLLKLD